MLVFAGATACPARDFLDGYNGKGWSPDNHWLAFNPIGENSLFFLSPHDGKSYLLKPVGDAFVDRRNTFSGESPARAGRRLATATIIVSSPGQSKLEIVDWSPNVNAVAYSLDRKTRGVFSLLEQAVTSRISASEPLPWESKSDVRVVFETTTARCSLRIAQPGGKIVKEVTFEEPKEIRQMSLLRFSDVSFLSPDKQFLLYPRFKDSGWQLFRESVAGDGPPRALTEPAPDPPLEWKLSPDSRSLAVVESPTRLQVGAVDDWAHAQNISLSNLWLTVAWSPDSRYLAGNAKELLYMLAPGTNDLALVSDFCSPIYWGWRGTRLFFNDVRAHSTSLWGVDVERSRKPEQIVKPREWQSAPHDRTISPDGTMFVCLMMEQDPEGQLSPQVWKIDLNPNAEWQKLYTFKHGQ
jgi:hypothetical protein